jgi:uncharacterized protein YcfJ
VAKYFILLISFILTSYSDQRALTLQATVTSAEPVYETVVDKIPYEECTEVKVPITQNQDNTNILGGLLGGAIGRNIGKGHGKDAATIGGTVIASGAKDSKSVFGGVLGGLLGKQFGKGKGKEAAMVAGTLLGSKIMQPRAKETGEYKIEKRCQTLYRESPRKVLVGYNLKAMLFGTEIQKFSSQKLDTIPVSINAQY